MTSRLTLISSSACNKKKWRIKPQRSKPTLKGKIKILTPKSVNSNNNSRTKQSWGFNSQPKSKSSDRSWRTRASSKPACCRSRESETNS